ncbi:MAG: DUF4446 family protein [Candidatus Levybacteria bacterium]|nr:DUF4446 family protein [Candidatus Levybacteria bacterium]
MPYDFILPVFAFLFLCIVVLAVLVWQLTSHYNKLTKGITEKSLKVVLENILRQVDVSRKDIDYLKSWCDTIEKDGRLHIQKVGLVRFNPFKDTGGDQSFALSLIDESDTGVVISGLYSRSGTRWYAKRIVKGKALEYELSEEEKKAIKEASKK